MQYIDTPAPSNGPTLVLVHGSRHSKSCWSGIQQQQAAAGVESIPPTLAGHGADDDRLRVTRDDYVRSVTDGQKRLPGSQVLVGQRFAGGVLSRVAELSDGA